MRIRRVDPKCFFADRLTDKAPEPKTGPNDVVVDVYSAALNFFGELTSNVAFAEYQAHVCNFRLL